MGNRLVKIGKAAEMPGIPPEVLRQWEKTGELRPARKTRGGTRDYAVADLLGSANEAAPTLCHARVSGRDRKADLDRQQAALEAYCAAKGWQAETIRDLGSGMHCRKAGLPRRLDLIMKRRIRRLVPTHKDRLLRFGADLVFALCEWQGIEIVIIHKGEPPSFEEELAQDVLEIITVCSARLYGRRSPKARQWIDALQSAQAPA